MAVNGLNYTSGNTLNFTTAGATRGLVDNTGKWGFGTLSPSSIVHISGATDPLTITGLQSGTTDVSILSIDANGVVGTRGDIVVGGSITDNVITLTDSDSSTTDLTVDAITSLGYNGSWGVSGDTTGNATASVALPFITSGSYDAGTDTLTLDVNDASGVSDITISGFEGSDTFVTGGTFSSGDLVLGLNDGTSAQTISGLWTNIPNSALINPGFVLGSTTIELGDTVGTVDGLTSVTSDDFIGDLQGNADTASQWAGSITLSLGTDLSGSVDFDGSGNVTLNASLEADTVDTAELVDGAVTNIKLANDSVTLGSTEITLGAAATTDINGLNGITATTFTGELVGNASSATVLETGRDFSIEGDITASAVSFNGSGNVVLNATIDTGAVTNDMLAGNIANDKLVNSGFLTSGTTGGGSIDLGDSIIFTSTDGSVSISANNGTFDLEVVDGTDTTITGGTYNESAGTLELRNNDGGTINISGTWDYFSGVTEADNQLTFKSNDNTDSSVTIKAMTGGTFDLASGVITAEGSDSPSNISLGTDFVTGVTEANNVISVTKNGGSAVDSTIQAVTGLTIADNVIGYEGSGSLGAGVTVDAITSLGYNGSWGVSGETTGNATASVSLPFITGGNYNAGNDTLTLTVNGSDESDITISGFEGSDTFLTGVTVGDDTGVVSFGLNDATEDFTASNFNFSTSGDSGSSTVNLRGGFKIAGDTGITTVDNGSGVISIDLDDTAVTPGSYGAADTVATFTVDQQGRLTEAGTETIDIVASQVSDFAASAKTAVFQIANFEDSSNIDFTVTAGDKVSADLIDSGVSAGNYGSSSQVAQFDIDAKGRMTAVSGVTIDGSAIDNNTLTFNGTDGGSSASAALNGSITFTSLDNSVAITGDGTTIDVQVSDAAIKNIYTEDGTLTSARTVTQSSNTLEFVGGDFEIDGEFHYDVANSNFGMGTTTPNANAILELNSTTQGFLFPRMTETERGNLTEVQGLMVYQTDGDEGIYICKSFGWVQVI